MRGLIVFLMLLGRAPADEPDQEIAKRHFERGVARYNAGDYPGALQEFEAARKVHPVPALDYNIARCYDRMERPEEAVTGYEQYLLSEDNPPDAPLVRQRVDTLKARIRGAPSPAPAVVPAAVARGVSAPASEDGGHTLRVAGITLGAVGLASLVVGLSTGILAQQASDDLSRLDQTRPRVQFDPGKESEGKTDRILEGVFLGIGAVGAATAVVLFALGHRAGRARAMSLRSGGGVCVSY